jgi:hypothetical protein
MPPKIDKSDVYKRLKIVFPNYTFDMSDYKNTHCKIISTCDKGHTSQQSVKNLLKGHGCNICGNKSSSEKQKSNFNDVLKKFRDTHGDKYDYSNFKYSKNRVSSVIKCPIHGDFEQSPWSHMKGHGCPSCSNNKRFTTEDFISKSNGIHNNKYDYSKVDYKNMHKSVIIICPKHGEFSQIPMTHVGQMSGCPKCNQSLGERLIEKFLIKNGIKYIPQKKIEGCVSKSNLIFDFFLPEYNTCVEFNGIQHYYPVDIFGGKKSFEDTKLRDSIKSEFCKNNNIPLIIIKQDKKYIDLKDIEEQINNITKSLNKNEGVLKLTNF